jgi:intein/homing endonuclease
MKKEKVLKIKSQKKGVLLPYTEDIIKMYQSLTSLQKIAEQYNVHYSSVRNLLVKNNIPIKHVSSSCYKINENFFETIDTEEKAYILGFIYADGCVHDTVSYTKYLTLSCAEQDCEHLLKIRNILCPNYTIHITDFNSRYNKNAQKTHKISIGNNKLCDDLTQHGCVPRKSKVLIFPTSVPDRLLPHFIRGYFDGDGSIFIRKKLPHKSISFIGTLEFLQGIQDIFVNLLGCNSTTIYYCKRDHIYEYRIHQGSDILLIRDYFYTNATIFLERKHSKFYLE